jgi:proteasome accessory factor B
MMRLHGLFAAGRFPNARSLAEELEVSQKTVLRDIEFMRDRLGLPIEYHPSRFGFHYTAPVDAFPTMQISEGELVALLVAEKALHQHRGTPFEKPLLAALRKLERSLPDTVSLNLRDWDQTISFRSSTEPMEDVPLIDALAKAAAEREELRILYRKPGSKEPAPRVVHPLHVANVNGEWYLFAHDTDRGGIRTFAGTRVVGSEPTGRSFERPADFDIDRYLGDSFGIFSREGDFDVVVRFTPAVAGYIREKRWHPSQSLVDLPDGGVELRLHLGSLVEVQRWILGWGPDARVAGPPELVARMQDAIQRMGDRYR